VIEMVDDNYGMPDQTWRDHGEWSRCDANPYAEELVIGQAVRVNFRDPQEFAAQPIGYIRQFAVIKGMGYGYVQWGEEPARPVPQWALVKA
jgi:hypothetical protein